MTTPQHRVHTPDPDTVEVRETSDSDDSDGLFRIRMPVTSTAEARDGIAFDRSKVEGFRDQIAGERIPVFLDHGRNEQTGSRYSALGKVGYLDAPELAERDAATDLVADFVLADPAEIDGDVGQMREALTWLRHQADLGLPIASSIGWSDDTGDRDVPGGADFLEASIVGIPSDARTTTASAEPATLARAVSAASTDFDVDTFVRAFNRLTTSDTRAEYEVGDETVEITPPDAMQNAATLALAKADEVDADCGTGVGSDRARQIAGDDVGPEVVDEIAAYLTSHEEDVTAEGPPSDWSGEEWADCGNLQYAKWGGTGTGTGLEWAQSKANEVAEANGEELPYPERRGETMTEDTDTESGEQPDDTNADEQGGMDASEYRESMLEMQHNQTETLNTVAEALREDGEDGDEDDEDDEDEDMGESSENSSDADDADERTVTLDGEERTVDEALTELRDAVDEAEPDEPETTDRAASDDEDSDESTQTGGFGFAAMED